MFDLTLIKNIPCEEIAHRYGISLKRSNNRLWGKIRENEKTASFSINLENNLWYDFGMNKGGSVIDLVAELENIPSNKAIKLLADIYGVKSDDEGAYPQFIGLSDSEYLELGIYPDLVTKNFKFDLDKHSIDQLKEWSKKYSMPVIKLAVKYPKLYDAMIKKRALKIIQDETDSFLSMVHIFQTSSNKMDVNYAEISCKEDELSINNKIELLTKALVNKEDFSYLKVSFNNFFK